MESLLKVQSELKAPKNQFNAFGKYKYRSCEDILEAAKPLCIENGLLLTLSDEVVNVGDRNYVKATASVTSGKESHSVTAYACEPSEKKGMDSSQITGAASSYARKYALNGLFCIDDTKDADTDEHKKQVDNAPKQPVATPPAPQFATEVQKTTFISDIKKAKSLADIDKVREEAKKVWNTLPKATQEAIKTEADEKKKSFTN